MLIMIYVVKGSNLIMTSFDHLLCSTYVLLIYFFFISFCLGGGWGEAEQGHATDTATYGRGIDHLAW